MDSSEEPRKKKISAILIFEAVGRPAEKLSEVLEEIIKKIDEENGISVISKSVHEPVEMKEQKDFFTDFAEVEVEVDDAMYIVMLVFKYMPAHIEVISPETISISNSGFNEIFNELTRRLHGYDEIARIVQTEKAILENKLRGVMEQQKNSEKEKPMKEKKKD